MKKSNSEIIEDLKYILKRMNRLMESFRLEKEKALENHGIEALEKLRERSRFVYQMRIAEYFRDIIRLENGITSNQAGMEEADDLAKLCRSQVMELHAHFSSAPNRLIRAIKAEERGN